MSGYIIPCNMFTLRIVVNITIGKISKASKREIYEEEINMLSGN